MQYLKQLPNGNRVSVDEATHNIDSYNKYYLPIINTMGLTIYRCHKGDNSPKVDKPLRYGGRNRGGDRVWHGC